MKGTLEMGYPLERQRVILPRRLTVAHQVGSRGVESEGSFSFYPGYVSMVPPEAQIFINTGLLHYGRAQDIEGCGVIKA